MIYEGGAVPPDHTIVRNAAPEGIEDENLITGCGTAAGDITFHGVGFSPQRLDRFCNRKKGGKNNVLIRLNDKSPKPFVEQDGSVRLCDDL
ncbi:unnamed protein product [Bursaphelenchus xylophilus]|uniref:(pine wood nematode) hypothetical protein n=1 Tax=Bursaphelenchus xylophilus TaxID=6326 RepID=A0A1I7SDZ6_BURXY|nr:unnamed protein product [Bursaphelenchus xylophilus]CAG9113081.1 unnamed protein product [Bursaphelenchus xylophilus]